MLCEPAFSEYARMHVFRMPQRDWTPSLRSIPNLFNTDDYVILWEEVKDKFFKLMT